MRTDQMKNVFLVFTMLLAVSSPIQAQVDAALEAKRVKESVDIRFENGFRYAVDNSLRRTQFRELKPKQQFSSESSVNIRLAFLNPLEFEWRLSTESKPEPLLEGVTQFLALAAGFPGTAAAQAPAAAGSVAAADTRTLAMLIGASSTPLVNGIGDPSLLEWIMWTDVFTQCQDETRRDQVQQAAQQLDELLYAGGESHTGTISSAADFADVLTKSVGALRQAGSLAKLRDALSDASNAGRKLNEANESGKRQADALVVLAGAVASKDTTGLCKAMQRYTERVFPAASGRAKEVIGRREALVASLQLMTSQIRSLLPSDHTDSSFFLKEIGGTSGERVAVTLTVTRRDVAIVNGGLEVKVGESKTVSFELMQHQSLVPEFKAGIVYSPVTFPRFKTNAVNGQHVIAEAEEYRPNTIPMSMLSLVPNGWSGITRPIGQVGIGLTTEAALVLAGVGFRFSSPLPFTLTAGALFPFVQSLKDGAKVGDVVAGEADLTTKIERRISGRASFYIGIQR